MSNPDFQTLFRPVLETIADGAVWSMADVRDAVAVRSGVDADDREVRTASGGRQYDGRVHWAVTYLAQSSAVQRVARGRIQITPRGHELLAEGPERITWRYLLKYPEFAEFQARARASPTNGSSTSTDQGDVDSGPDVDPQEQIAGAIAEIDAAVAMEVIDRIKAQAPDFLERIIIDLMVAMGYGGHLGHTEHLGGSGDEGLDGVIHQDALGLERVYLQAKRFADKTVGRPDIQGFAGALQGAGATRGVFITTSKFSAEARDFATRLPARVVLIDGPELGRLLVQYRVGVQVKHTFDVVEVDDDAFED